MSGVPPLIVPDIDLTDETESAMPDDRSAQAEKPSSAAMHPGAGFQLRRWAGRPAAETVRALGEFATPDVSDIMNRLYSMESGIRLLKSGDHRIRGTACTVKVFPGDNLMVHKALDLAEPGDVIVVDAQASSANAVLGGLIST